VDALGTLHPLTARHAEFGLDGSVVEELVGVGHVIAQGWVVALFTDVVDIESGFQGVAQDHVHLKRAELKSVEPLILFAAL